MLTSEMIKAKGRELGADLVGICAASAINENPPDPRWPQTPARIWPECRSVIVLAKRVPWGLLWFADDTSKTYPPQLVMKRLDDISLELSYFIEEQGNHACPVPQQFTDTALKKGSYGPLSLRHAAVEAGLGTLGLNMMLITPEFGPRVYLAAVLTDAELLYDSRLTKKQCLGPACGRCLIACPSDAVEYWALNKKKCSENAQKYGISSFINFAKKVSEASSPEERQAILSSSDVINYWQALRTGSMAYGGCFRCWEVCPVGEDFVPHLRAKYGRLEDRLPARMEKRKAMLQQEKSDHLAGPVRHSLRWIGGQL